ncbi:MAG: glycerophosphodiester phosphodiesterase [Pyrinomonadaceae bacterium]
MPATPRPLVIAHRGASAFAPENTLPAFQLALDAGADGVELDVRLSRDGVPVVIHDRNLKRLAGLPDAVADLTTDQLAGIDLGSRFNNARPKRARAEFTGVGVPTLAAVLEMFTQSDAAVHIELKIDRKHELRPLVNAVCAVVHTSPVLSRIVLSSFRLTALSEAKHVLPSVRTSALFAPSIMRFIKRRRHMISLARAFGTNEISPYRSLVTPKLASLAREIGMPINIWTCDNQKWIDRAKKLGITALMTNDPAKLLAHRSSIESDEFSR